MFHKLRWRVAAAYAFLILISIGLLSVYVSHYVRSGYLDSLETQLVEEARLVGESVLIHVSSEDAPDLPGLVARLGANLDARITVVGTDGTVLGDSQEDSATMTNHADRPEVMQALVGSTGMSIRYSSTLGYDMMYVAVRIVNEGGEVEGISRVALSLKDVNDSMSVINRSIIFGAIITAAAGIGVALLLSKRTTRSVEELTLAAGRMAEGDLEQKIPVLSSDEVGDLAGAFNRMAASMKSAMGQLTDERDRMAAVVSHITDGLLVIDEHGLVTFVNPAAQTILGIDSDAVGKPLIEAVRDYELQQVVERCLASKRVETAYLNLARRGQHLYAIAAPLQHENAHLLLVRDLTELRRLERVRSDFVANISHELRTPLASLKVLAETLEDGAIEDPAVAGDYLQRISHEVDKLAQMVQELGELSRIESGEAPLRKAPVKIGAVIEEAAKRLREQAIRASIDLEVKVGPALPVVELDQDRIEQVLVNLLHNAIKFTLPGGHVRVSASESDGNLMVSVEDDGAGIMPEDLPRIFERFYKADKARSGKGTGLGLAIARHIVEAHGGRIWAESEPGKGTTFTFTLPLGSA